MSNKIFTSKNVRYIEYLKNFHLYRKWAYLYCTSYCNKKCPTCCNKHYMESIKGYHFNLDKVKQIDLSKFTDIVITGGEPGILLKNEKINLYNYLQSKYNKANIQVFTNGYKIEEWPKKLHKRIHIDIYEENPILYYDNSDFIIVLNETHYSNIDRIKCLVSNIKGKLFLKNDSVKPLNIDRYKFLLNCLNFDTVKLNINNNHIKINNIKIENYAACYSLPKGYNVSSLHRSISLHNKCVCEYFNCTS